MSSVSKTVEISLDTEERELLEKAIEMCKEISRECVNECMYVEECCVFECLVNDFNSNRGKLSAQIDIEE